MSISHFVLLIFAFFVTAHGFQQVAWILLAFVAFAKEQESPAKSEYTRKLS
jgi:hypothetical protein